MGRRPGRRSTEAALASASLECVSGSRKNGSATALGYPQVIPMAHAVLALLRPLVAEFENRHGLPIPANLIRELARLFFRFFTLLARG